MCGLAGIYNASKYIVYLNLYAVCLYNCSHNRRAYIMYYIIILYMLYIYSVAAYPFSELSVFSSANLLVYI